jgi:hypothetical protein
MVKADICTEGLSGALVSPQECGRIITPFPKGKDVKVLQQDLGNAYSLSPSMDV